jgi:hypothetical protein
MAGAGEGEFVVSARGSGQKQNTRIWDYALTIAVILLILAFMALLLNREMHPIAAGQGAFEPVWDCASDVGENQVCVRKPQHPIVHPTAPTKP